MVPQGSTLLNTSALTQVTAAINSINTCAELQELVNEAFASLAALKQAIIAQIAALLPIQELLNAPEAALGAIITWIQNFITAVLTPLFKPYETLVAQEAQLAIQIAALVEAVQNAEKRLAKCSITIPSI